MATPGGILELDESFEAGVRREVAEETGVSVVVERLTGVYKNLKLGVVALVFRCRATSGSKNFTDEALEVRWMREAEIAEVMVPAFAIRVFDAFGDRPQFRTHDGVNIVGP